MRIGLAGPTQLQVRAQSGSQGGADKPAQKDEYQRSTDIYSYKTTAKSGAQRGEEIYYYKCWMISPLLVADHCNRNRGTSFFGLTRTPSMAPSSVELTRPAKAVEA